MSTVRTTQSHQMIFVNLPVSDVAETRRFWTELGYSFNEELCDDSRCLALELGPNIYAMLLNREFFDSFHDAASVPGAREALLCLSADSREEVEQLSQLATAAGATLIRTEDHGYMYGQSFADPDDHVWEVMWMDVDAARQADAFAGEAATV